MAIVLLPFVIEQILPNNRSAMEVAAVLAPTIAFCFRYLAGKRQIASNQCSPAVRNFQLIVFCAGVFPLAALECLIILFHVLPKVGKIEKVIDVFGVLIAIYLSAMIVAMYPGRTQQDVEPE